MQKTVCVYLSIFSGGVLHFIFHFFFGIHCATYHEPSCAGGSSIVIILSALLSATAVGGRRGAAVVLTVESELVVVHRSGRVGSTPYAPRYHIIMSYIHAPHFILYLVDK